MSTTTTSTTTTNTPAPTLNQVELEFGINVDDDGIEAAEAEIKERILSDSGLDIQVSLQSI